MKNNKSQHLVGNALDFNVEEGGKSCNYSCLKDVYYNRGKVAQFPRTRSFIVALNGTKLSLTPL